MKLQAIQRNLGEHRLEDIGSPSHLFQLVIVDVPADFPPLRTLNTHFDNLPTLLTPLIGREQEEVASLLDKSLLQQIEQKDGEPRLFMLETIRAYGRECPLGVKQKKGIYSNVYYCFRSLLSRWDWQIQPDRQSGKQRRPIGETRCCCRHRHPVARAACSLWNGWPNDGSDPQRLPLRSLSY